MSETAVNPRSSWLFSRTIDLWTFGGSATLSLVLVFVGWQLNLLDRDSPEWTWITCVLLVDVAHVYATGFRVYFDRDELRRRPGLYLGTPLAAFAVGWAIYSENPATYWRVLAYLAVFHFVRQQYGWVMLYRAKAHETDRFGRWLDTATIYIATLHPLCYWHAHLPRRFDWMTPGDFTALPAWFPSVTGVLWIALLGAYFSRSLLRGLRHNVWTPGKDLVVATTALCWYVGIVVFDSDYAFTVTNVIIHGVPYGVLVYFYWRRRQTPDETQRDSGWKAAVLFLSTLWFLAFLEELFWDRGVWRERSYLFGPWQADTLHGLLVPLLGTPQLTHYILDGFIWKRRSNREFEQSMIEDDR